MRQTHVEDATSRSRFTTFYFLEINRSPDGKTRVRSTRVDSNYNVTESNYTYANKISERLHINTKFYLSRSLNTFWTQIFTNVNLANINSEKLTHDNYHVALISHRGFFSK